MTQVNERVLEAAKLAQELSEERGWTLTRAAVKVAKILDLSNDEWRDLITTL